MKKNFIILAASALVFAACSNSDLRNDIQGELIEIGFSTFNEKITRAGAENSGIEAKHSLNTHHTTFKVWGYKTVSGTPSSVFGEDGTGTQVNWVPANSAWEYSPLRFWDKSATNYKFYAAAPASESWTYANDKISLASFSVDGSTIAASATINADANFGPKDIMISEDVTVESAGYTATKVQLNFIHLLTRLNIGVNKSATLNNYYVKLKSIKVFNMVDGGDFSEATAAVQSGSIARWSANNSVSTASTNGYGYETDTEVKTNFNYVYQSLFIPQQVDYVADIPLNGNSLGASSKPYLKISYELYSGTKYEQSEIDGAQENDDAYGKTTDDFKTSTLALVDSYTYAYNLADLFNGTSSSDNVAFNEGWMNTLKITIEPVAINFDADVYEWKPTTDVNVNIPDINQ